MGTGCLRRPADLVAHQGPENDQARAPAILQQTPGTLKVGGLHVWLAWLRDRTQNGPVPTSSAILQFLLHETVFDGADVSLEGATNWDKSQLHMYRSHRDKSSIPFAQTTAHSLHGPQACSVISMYFAERLAHTAHRC